MSHLSQQPISQRLLETALTYVDDNAKGSIEVSWVPWHMKVEGHDRADELAAVTELKPTGYTTTIYRQLRKDLQDT
jgi:ribonuclease HI